MSEGYSAAAAAKSLQSSTTLWDTIDGSPPGSPVPGILQARTLEWVAIYSTRMHFWSPRLKVIPPNLHFRSPWYAHSQWYLKKEQWLFLSILSLSRCLPHGRRSLESCSPRGRWGSDTTERLHFHALEKETATHSSVLAWRIPGMGEPGGLLSMELHRVGHYWSDLTAAAAAGASPVVQR